MPRLIFVVPCENTLVGAGQQVSLINIIAEFQINVPAQQQLQQHAAVPYRWFIAAQWQFLEADRDHQWEQRLRIVHNNGEPTLFGHITPFNHDYAKPIHRMIAEIAVVPVLIAGDYHLDASYREIETEEWHIGGIYPFTITRT